MKSIFKVTYYVYFKCNDNSQADYLEEFWIWNKPTFNSWSYNKRQQHKKENKVECVVENCGKI